MGITRLRVWVIRAALAAHPVKSSGQGLFPAPETVCDSAIEQNLLLWSRGALQGQRQELRSRIV
jgi:hypothetical protein